MTKSKHIPFKLQDTFSKELPADPITENTRRQVQEACYSFVIPRIPSDPKLLHVSQEIAADLGLDNDYLASDQFRDIVSGAQIIIGSRPYAMCYGGHQFGNWAGQLGDGRAINLGEVEHKGKVWALQLKGSGETPYSRTADGLAVLRSSIREHLCSEAMYHLGVPTTRSLSLSLTGDQVLRDIMYDGNSAYEKGAVVCRVAPNFIRFGNFQLLASRGQFDVLKQLADYTIQHFYPTVTLGTPEAYVQLMQEVSSRTLQMVIDWQRVGFVHGVMNTDNMSILGLTIDYGPYGWLEGYDPDWTPNTTDKQHKRYKFGSQPSIALWNLYQLANALYPLVNDPKPLEAILEEYKKQYQIQNLEMHRSKLGLAKKEDEDLALIQELEKTLQLAEIDMTIFYRELANYEGKKDDSDFGILAIHNAFYTSNSLTTTIHDAWNNWFQKYKSRLEKESRSDADRKVSMDAVNPKYVLRNYMAQIAIDAADNGDYSIIDELYTMLKKPYIEQIEYQKWYAKRPEWARVKVGCSMLSCSS